MAPGRGKVAILEKLWDLANELQLKPALLRDNLCLLKDRYGQTAWHIAARRGYIELLEKMWDFAQKNCS
jgi:ankyrin repeat protein